MIQINLLQPKGTGIGFRAQARALIELYLEIVMTFKIRSWVGEFLDKMEGKI